jgi:hypothetical protein
MSRMQILVVAIFLLFPFLVTSALAERNCSDGTCKCLGVPDCKNLDMSGKCSGPIQCGHPGEPCSCVSKSKATTNSIAPEKPVNKSQ